MNTKRILSSVVTGLILTGSLAMAAPGNDRARSKANVRAAKQTTTMTTGGHAAVRTRSFATGGNTAVRTGTVRNRSTVFIGGNTTAVRTGTVRNRSTVFVGGSSFGFGYPYYSYGFGYPYYSYGYYPYGYYGYYPYDYTYGYYYNRPAYGAYNGSIVVQVQTRLGPSGLLSRRDRRSDGAAHPLRYSSV